MNDYKKEIERILHSVVAIDGDRYDSDDQEYFTNQLLALISKAREDLIEEIEEEWIKATDDRKFFDFLDSLKGESGDK